MPAKPALKTCGQGRKQVSFASAKGRGRLDERPTATHVVCEAARAPAERVARQVAEVAARHELVRLERRRVVGREHGPGRGEHDGRRLRRLPVGARPAQLGRREEVERAAAGARHGAVARVGGDYGIPLSVRVDPRAHGGIRQIAVEVEPENVLGRAEVGQRPRAVSALRAAQLERHLRVRAPGPRAAALAEARAGHAVVVAHHEAAARAARAVRLGQRRERRLDAEVGPVDAVRRDLVTPSGRHAVALIRPLKDVPRPVVGNERAGNVVPIRRLHAGRVVGDARLKPVGARVRRRRRVHARLCRALGRARPVRRRAHLGRDAALEAAALRVGRAALGRAVGPRAAVRVRHAQRLALERGRLPVVRALRGVAVPLSHIVIEAREVLPVCWTRVGRRRRRRSERQRDRERERERQQHRGRHRRRVWRGPPRVIGGASDRCRPNFQSRVLSLRHTRHDRAKLTVLRFAEGCAREAGVVR